MLYKKKKKYENNFEQNLNDLFDIAHKIRRRLAISFITTTKKTLLDSMQGINMKLSEIKK